MIMTGWDTIAHTLGLQNLSFVDNPDLNIELRLASSISFAFIDQRELPHVGLILGVHASILLLLYFDCSHKATASSLFISHILFIK